MDTAADPPGCRCAGPAIAYNLLGSAWDVLGIKDNRRAERSAHWLTMTASWDDGSPPVRSCPLWSTEPRAVHLCRPIWTVGGRGWSDRRSWPGRGEFAVAATWGRRRSV